MRGLKLFGVLTIVVLLAVTVAGCTQGGESPTTTETVTGTYTPTPALKKVF